MPQGILGLSPALAEGNDYGYVLDNMAKGGLIKSRAFSLDLRSVDDQTGKPTITGPIMAGVHDRLTRP
jgi:hypothetical protein